MLSRIKIQVTNGPNSDVGFGQRLKEEEEDDKKNDHEKENEPNVISHPMPEISPAGSYNIGPIESMGMPENPIFENNIGSIFGNCTIPEIDSIENELSSPSSHSSSPNSWVHSGNNQNGGIQTLNFSYNHHKSVLESSSMDMSNIVIYSGNF